MEKTYMCTLSHQVPTTGGGFRTFELGKEYPDSIIPAVSREWTDKGPGDPSPALFEPSVIAVSRSPERSEGEAKQSQAGTEKKAVKGPEVKGDDN